MGKKFTWILVPLFFLLVVKEGVAEGSMVFSTIGKDVDFPTKSIALKVVREAYRRLDISVTTVEYPALRALQVSNSGMVDGELFRAGGVQEAFSNLIMIPVPIYENEWVAFAKSRNFSLDGCDSLRSYRIAIERGVPPAENCTRGMQVLALTNEIQMFKMVFVGRADIAVDALLDGLAVMKDNNIKGLTPLQPALFKAQLYHYLHQKNQHLVEPITNAIREVANEGLPMEYERAYLRAQSED